MRFFKFRGLFILLTVFLLTGFSDRNNFNIANDKIAETVLINGKFYTLNKSKKWVKAIAIKNGVITYAGSVKGAGVYKNETTKIIDLKGKFALPAFVDSHLHPLTNSYAALFQVALFNLDSPEKYLKAIKIFAQNIPENQWIVGAGFDASVFNQRGPRKEVLDKILPNRPIAIVDRDIHSMLVNSKALKLMGIKKNTPNPDGGSIKRDKNGVATGLLIDDSAMNLARDFFPTANKDQYKKSLLWMQDWLNSKGITTAHDAWIEFNENYYKAFDELAKEGKLTVRYRGSWFIDSNENYNYQINEGLELSEKFKHPHFQVKSFKFLTDNVLEQGSALLLDESNKLIGVRNWQQEAMQKAYIKIDKAGQQIHTHAVGDGAVRVTLDALDKVRLKNGDKDSRHSLAHVEIATPADIQRMGNLGLTAHLTTVNLETEPDHLENTGSKFHPVKSLIDAGANVAIASDYATSNPDVIRSIFGAIKRNNAEAANLEEMLRAATINGAYANFLEHDVGSLEVGKKADIVVLDRNLFEVSTEDIPKVKIEMTFFEGKKVYSLSPSTATASKPPQGDFFKMPAD